MNHGSIPTTALNVSSVKEAAHHLSLLVSELRNRAKRVETANYWLLAAIILIVITSICIFWQADAIATNYVGEALKEKLEQRQVLLQNIREKEKEIPNAERELILLQSARNGLEPLDALLSDLLKPFLEEHGDDKDPVAPDRREEMSNRFQWHLVNPAVREARKVFSAIENQESDVIINFRGEHKLNAIMLSKLRAITAPHGLLPATP